MKENFEIIKAQVDIKNLAVYLLGGPERGMFKYPGEKTASIKIYSQTNSFFDFGRGVGGDCIKLWSHIRHCDSWTALQEVAIVFGISTTLTEADKENIIAKIKFRTSIRITASADPDGCQPAGNSGFHQIGRSQIRKWA